METAISTIKLAVQTALTPPMGPVSIEIPIDLQRAKIQRPGELDNFVLPLPPPRTPSDRELDELAERVLQAKRPMLWLGHGALQAGAEAAKLLDLGDQSGRHGLRLDRGEPEAFVGVTQREVKKVPLLRGKTVVNLFFEPSTRTRTTFELAAKRLSADVMNLNIEASAAKKGESLADTLRTAMANVYLTPANGSADELRASVCIGVSSLAPGRDDANSLLARAQQALAQARLDGPGQLAMAAQRHEGR